MSALALPRPANLDTRFGDVVEGDVYMISERIKELDPSLFVTYDERADHPYAIVERCHDDVDRLVFRTKELDARIIGKLRYLLHVPFEERFEEAERLATRAETEREQKELDELYEQVGAPMWGLLERTGAIETRNLSFPKRGVTGGKGSRGKS